ncbi:MAG TPA: hypothetical protein VN698_14525 [Bacteroidia bacterium]|nr:hypothetical protein [Bacteroidia bacterium]
MKTEIELLDEKIISLENRRAHELKLLKEHFYIIHEELKPINLVKNTLKEMFSSPELKNNAIGNAMGLATGYLSKKIIVGSSHNPIKNILGAVLQFAVANTVSKHSNTIKAVGEILIGRLSKRIKQSVANEADSEPLFL